MSMVVTEKDRYRQRRERSREEERAILRDTSFARFRMRDMRPLIPAMRAVLLPVVFPVLLVWGLISALVGVVVGATVFVLGQVGRVLVRPNQ